MKLLEKPHSQLTWSKEIESTFTYIKQALGMAPALGLPDAGKLFHLYCSDAGSHYNAVLCQVHGDRRRPEGYYACIKGAVEKGLDPCLSAVECACWALDVTEPVVRFGSIVLHTAHSPLEVIMRGRVKGASSHRLAKWKIRLTARDNMTIVRDTVINPADYLAGTHSGVEHICECIEQDKPGVAKEEPLTTGQHLFVDSSRFYVDGRAHTGWAVWNAESQESGTDSAQVAELVVLREALDWAPDEDLTIYTDSRYAFWNST